VEIDETNMAIIEFLQDGRMSFKKIAEKLGYSEGTVRTRVKKMQSKGILEITGMVNPDSLPDHSIIMMGVRLKDMDLVKKGEEFSALKGVISVSIVTGCYDLILTVMLTKEVSMLEFYTKEVKKVKNVRAVETFKVFKSFDLKVPMTLI
jgi:Lrp/AsnC family transcriptional regulator, regulator for asnA, asnC and gidA